MLLSAVLLLFFIDDLITSQISRGYVSCTLYCFSLKFIAIDNIVTNDLLCIQFFDINISFTFYIPVNYATCYSLMTYHISVNGTVRYYVSVNLYFKILCSAVAIVRESYFYWWLIRRKGGRNL